MSRHAEYRSVFSELIDTLKKNPVDVIFVAGDIWHTKTAGLTPEYIDFMRWWLLSLSECAPLHMMLGNHDGNLTNLERQDAVTPIVSALGSDRIFLYKKSGVYPFAPGWNFCVFSLFDKEGWPLVSPKSGDANIACYHGAVRSSITETGWPIEEGPSLDFFDGYNAVLLGDIHRQQFLGAPKNGQPWIAYPGTPVCQNYAEGEQEHGYLRWEFSDCGDVSSVKFVVLKQPNPFVTVEWTGNRKEFVEKVTNCLPVGARVRIKSSEFITQDDFNAISDILKKKISASEVVVKSEIVHKRDVFSAGGFEMMKDDLRNVEVLTILLRDFYRKSQVTDAEWDDISSLVERCLKSAISDDELPRHVIWRVNELSFNNLFSYGKDNRINFEKLSGIVGIFGQNRSGKSSIVGTLMYGLFNTSDRGSIKNLFVINDRKQYCDAQIDFSVGTSRYKLVRETNKIDRKTGVFAATSLELHALVDGTTVSMNGEQRSDTDKILRSLIGTQDDFLLTSMSTQGDLNKFINEGSSFRKLILTKFLDLDIFEKMHELAKFELKTAQMSSKTIAKKDWSAEITRITEKIDKYDQLAHKLENKISELRAAHREVHEKLVIHKSTTTVTQADIDAATNEIKSHAANCEKISGMIGDIDAITSRLSAQYENLLSEISKFDEPELIKQKSLGVGIVSAYEKLVRDEEKCSEELARLERSVKKLNVVPCSDTFPTCMFIKDSHADKEVLVQRKEMHAGIVSALNAAKDVYDAWQAFNVESQLTKLTNLKSKERATADEIASLAPKRARLEAEEISALEKLESKKEALTKLIDAAQKSESLEALTLREEEKTIQDEIKRYDAMRVQTASGKGKAESELRILRDQKVEYERATEKIRVTELVAEAFSKRGIPTRIINSQLPMINSMISEILHGVVDYTVELQADEETNSLDVFINYGDSKRLVELGSGMEKLFASLAIRVALHAITSLPKTDVFVIDEGFGALDDIQIEPCNRLLRSLKRYFRTVIVITHVAGIKDSADMMIEIGRNEKDSHVYYV